MLAEVREGRAVLAMELREGVASFTCDDSSFKASQLPYRIDQLADVYLDFSDSFYIDEYDDGQGNSGHDDAFTNLGSTPPQGAFNVTYSCS